MLESKIHSMIWIARVPSKCNVADQPSRGITNSPLLFSATDDSAKASTELEMLVTQIGELGVRAE